MTISLSSLYAIYIYIYIYIFRIELFSKLKNDLLKISNTKNMKNKIKLA